MNREKLLQNVGQLVLLQPAPVRLDRYGRVLRDVRDPWRLERVSGDVARLKNIVTDHFVDLGLDQIYSYGSDPNAKNIGERHTGLLQLKVQLTIQGPRITVQLSARPGEPVLTAGGGAPRVHVPFEEFSATCPAYFEAVWGRRSADLWANLSARVDAFDRREGAQVGTSGYIARLEKANRRPNTS